jgi:hypothetical protein
LEEGFCLVDRAADRCESSIRRAWALHARLCASGRIRLRQRLLPVVCLLLSLGFGSVLRLWFGILRLRFGIVFRLCAG